MNSDNYQNYCLTSEMLLHQSYYSQAKRDNICEYTIERLPMGPKHTIEKPLQNVSVLKNVLLHGKQTAKQNYNPYSHTIPDMFPSYQTTPNNQIISHNPHQISSAEYLTSSSEISGSEQFFGNLQGQYQQQEYNQYSQNYPEHNVQSNNYVLFSSESSTLSTQYEQNKPKQQTTFNVQQSQINSGNNNNNVRQRNKNFQTTNHNNGQRGPYYNNVTDYPWMYKRTNANQGNGTDQKRTRQTYSRNQIFELEKEFRSNKYLARRQRMDLAKIINLTERQVKIWFQNRRMKEKKDKTVSPNNSVLTTASSTASKPVTKSNVLMNDEKQILNSAQVQLQSQQQFYEERQYFINNQNILTHYSNNSEDNNSYGNAIIRHNLVTDFVNTPNFSTTLENIQTQDKVGPSRCFVKRECRYGRDRGS